MSKNLCYRIIEQLGGGNLVGVHCELCFDSLSKPVLIGDVLAKLDERLNLVEWSPNGEEALPHFVLMAEWRKCGLTQSLQEIVAASGFHCLGCYCKLPHSDKECNQEEGLKHKNAYLLFEFLSKTFSIS